LLGVWRSPPLGPGFGGTWWRQVGCQTVREEGRAPAHGSFCCQAVAQKAAPSGGTAQSTALECIAVEVIDQARRSKGWAKGVLSRHHICAMPPDRSRTGRYRHASRSRLRRARWAAVHPAFLADVEGGARWWNGATWWWQLEVEGSGGGIHHWTPVSGQRGGGSRRWRKVVAALFC
jgi:hypothetical protein